MGKSHKQKEAPAPQLKQDHPLASRKNLYSLENKNGTVIALDATNFGIHLEGDTTLLPVNLPSSLQKAGIKINFSGAVKETDPAEFWAASPLLLTKAKEIK